MSCCGQRRRAHKPWLVSRPIRLRFVGEGKIQVKGKVTGKPYVFSEEARETDVEAHDARGFLQESIFVVAKVSSSVRGPVIDDHVEPDRS